MANKFLFFCMLFIGLSLQAQTLTKDFVVKKILVKNDTIQLDSVAINPQKFTVKNNALQVIAKTEYQINFNKAILIINSEKHKEITVSFFKYPNFVTKIYSPFNQKLILPEGTNTGTLYSLTTNKKEKEITLLDGLQTKGFITRGITAGNNQNAVTNSALDLEISGKISKNVTLRANIFDTNIPLQQNGYSQNITDFDRIFIEMYSNKWSVKAGDISLQNQDSYFMSFNKQVAGLQVKTAINNNFNVAASGAIVRGKFTKQEFVGLEGNQGPYKIVGPNNEPAIVIIAGSEQVFINGILLENTANYTVDYNLAEIEFNTTFPITNDMRIRIEFQYSDRNYTRFITYEEANYKSENLSINGYFYSESDAKNQPLQQDLTAAQQQILANAGNNTNLMVAESAFVDAFDESKILYKKTTVNTVEIFEYSNNPSDTLYAVNYTNVGANNGNYTVKKNTAIGTIFNYVGENQGDYLPIIRLIAPTKSQLMALKTNFNPTDKAQFNAEVAVSITDENLFSTINNENNTGVAAKIDWQQILLDKKWQLETKISHEFVQKNFATIQRWESVEFNRDWNILTNNATKNYFKSELLLKNKKNSFITYSYSNLNYINAFNGNKHEIQSKLKQKNTTFFADISFLKNTSTLENNSFFRAVATVEHRFNKSWLGSFVNFETNARKNKTTNQFVNTSHKYKEVETYFGIGDTTKIFAKLGVNFRNNDSIKQNTFTEINNRKSFYITSKLLQNKTTNLSVFANYRITENNFIPNEKHLNSSVVFNKQLFNNFLNLTTNYETSSGNVARQEFVYIKTEPGFGFYTWIDYNNNGVKDFDEFEIAQFKDQANYLRIPKPNLRFIATQRAKLNQTLVLNFNQWNTKKGFKKLLSHFTNESYLTAQNEQERIGDSFNFNPFNFNTENLINLNFSFRNSFYFNKNLQKYSTTFTYGTSENKQQYLIGNQENILKNYQLDFAHKFATFWLFNAMAKTTNNNLETENFTNRNYQIEGTEFQPKISFLYSSNNRLSAFYHFKNKENKLQDFEALKQQQFGLEYYYVNAKKHQISAGFNLFLNNFTGNVNTPVAYQMLEGLQAGKNYTWNLLFTKKLNAFLNLNLNYLGRKSENAKTIHTGSIELKALF